MSLVEYFIFPRYFVFGMMIRLDQNDNRTKNTPPYNNKTEKEPRIYNLVEIEQRSNNFEGLKSKQYPEKTLLKIHF